MHNLHPGYLLVDEENTWRSIEGVPGDSDRLAATAATAGGIANNKMVIADGVNVIEGENKGERSFIMSFERWIGIINSDSLEEINWEKLPEHPGDARYRMAIIGDEGRIFFAGGSSNPYNYSCIGYHGKPSMPESSISAYNLKEFSWQELAALPVAMIGSSFID